MASVRALVDMVAPSTKSPWLLSVASPLAWIASARASILPLAGYMAGKNAGRGMVGMSS